MQFLFPVPATSIVTQTFAEHVHAAQVNGWQNYNGGIDWAVPTGTPIRAAQSGKVAAVRRDATGYGVHVRIQHADGFQTIYGHLWDFAVQVGETVQPGQVIARSDNTGNSTGPHLHFELRRNNVPVDPAPLLAAFLPEPGGPGGGETPPTGGRPGEEIPTGEEPQSFPSLPLARIVSPVGLNIRMAPGVSNPIVGYLPGGTQVEVLRKTRDGDDAWLQVGHQQYIGMFVSGETYAVWLAPAAPQGEARRSRRRSKKG